MFVDALAWTAILLGEPEADAFRLRLAGAEVVVTSAIAKGGDFTLTDIEAA